jgi:hypothetical protein
MLLTDPAPQPRDSVSITDNRFFGGVIVVNPSMNTLPLEAIPFWKQWPPLVTKPKLSLPRSALGTSHSQRYGGKAAGP